MLLTTDSEQWLAVFGRFHLVLLHMPIGLLPGMFLLEFGAAIFRRPIPRGALLTLAVLTALTAVAAFFSGLVLADEKVQSDLLATHKYFAIAMGSVCVLLPLLAARKGRRPFRLMLAAGLALSVPTGHFGGTLVHKRNFLFKPLERAQTKNDQADSDKAQIDKPQIDEPQIDEPTTGKPTDQPTTNQVANGAGAAVPPDGNGTTTPPIAAAPDFEREILPIFTRVCGDCHGPEDPDGDLILTTKEGIQCLDRPEDERVIVAGDLGASLLLELLELPLDDEDHMPPADEVQLKPEELAKIRAWIGAGAKF